MTGVVPPAYLTANQTSSVILQRMLATLAASYPGLDVSEGSFVWDALSPVANELAMAASWAQQALALTFAQTSSGSYLDQRANEHGVYRLAAAAATGTVTFSGVSGTVIPAGTLVSTASTQTIPAIQFATNVTATISGTGSVSVGITASQGGANTNVAANAITLLVSPVAGVTSLTNAAATTGGTDTETDAALLSRYLIYVRNPSAGGNVADYTNWALAVAGVGGVSVVPVWNGGGTVQIVLIGTDKNPAAQSVVDAVQAYIAPAWSDTVEAHTLSVSGSGVTTDTSQTDSTDGTSEKIAYNSAGPGRLADVGFQTRLQAPGIWTVRVKAKVDGITGTSPLLSVGVWDETTQAWAQTQVSGGVNSLSSWKGNQLATTFTQELVTFYWNGTDVLDLRVDRLGASVPNPTTAPTLGHTSAGTGLLAGTYTVAYTWVNAVGETLTSPTATVTISAGDSISVTIPTLPPGATASNIYVSQAAGSGTLKLSTQITATSCTVTVLPTGAAVPGSNTTNGDQTTNLWIDVAIYRSTFSENTGQAKAPIGAQVTVVAATAVPIAVSVHLTIASGYSTSSVQTAVTNAITAYLQSVAFSSDNNVRWAKVANAILGVAGVTDYSSLTVNGGTSNVALTATQVPQLSGVTYT